MSRAEAAPVLGYANRDSLGVVMRGQATHWPTPLACRLQSRELLWDLAELRTADRAHRADDATVGQPPRLIACLECGRHFRTLGPHLRTHHLTGEQYRARHALPPGVVLISEHTAAIHAHRRRSCLGPARPPAPSRHDVLAAQREQLARAAEYEDWATAIAATAALHQRVAARQLGCAVSTIRRWRIRLGLAEGAERGSRRPAAPR